MKEHRLFIASTPPLIVAVSSRALFNLEEDHEICSESGLEAFHERRSRQCDDYFRPGVAFPLVRKLLAMRKRNANNPVVEIILISRNDPDTGLPVLNAIRHHGLDIQRAAFSGGDQPWRYLKPFGVHLFLSANSLDVQWALSQGVAAATILPGEAKSTGNDQGPIRIAFDGDSVLFSDEAEQVASSEGVAAFNEHERLHAGTPLAEGPFRGFLTALHELQKTAVGVSIRTSLVTSRGAPAYERALRTLQKWRIRLDEALFLAGMEKGVFLKPTFRTPMHQNGYFVSRCFLKISSFLVLNFFLGG